MGNMENRKTFFDRLVDLPENEIKDVGFAYDLVKMAHINQKRDSGERYVEHPRAVAIIKMDELGIIRRNSIIEDLNHDSIEDTPIFGNSTLPYSVWVPIANYRISKLFGDEVAQAIIALTKPKVDKVEIKTIEQAKNLYFCNLRNAPPDTILVKMCDRLHNLRSLKETSEEKQIRICRETVESYFAIFENVKEQYPNEHDYLIGKMKKEIVRYI
jgi:GTP pyrophosphokinase